MLPAGDLLVWVCALVDEVIKGGSCRCSGLALAWCGRARVRSCSRSVWCAACGFRLAVKAGPGGGVVRAGGIVAAAVSGRVVAADVAGAGRQLGGVLCDRGFGGAGCAASRASPRCRRAGLA
jgi:hypothetical protein